MAKQVKPRPSFLFQNDIDFAKNMKATDIYNQNFNTPELRQQNFDWNVGNQIESVIGVNPFKEVGKGISVYDETSGRIRIEDADTPETKSMKSLHNALVRGKGGLAEANFLKRIGEHTMTASWLDLLGINDSDPFDMSRKLEIDEEGLKYDGNSLSLSNSQKDLLSQYISRVNGDDVKKSFVDKIGETAVSLMMDIPLMLATGAIVGKGLQLGVSGLKAFEATRNVGEISSALLKGTNFWSRAAGQAVHQTINFNLLGFPQTVDAAKEGIGPAVSQIWHNAYMGTLASATGAAGVQIGKMTANVGTILKKNPALREEIAGVLGSFGFGYLSSGAIGEEDALATGLAFAATHFTNPKAYKRVIDMQKKANVVIKVNKSVNNIQDYFLEKDGKLFKIDSYEFKQKGTIKMTSDEAIEPAERSDEFLYYNQVQDMYHLSFKDALQSERVNGASSKLISRWIKEGNITKRQYNKSKDSYRMVADIVSASIISETKSKIYNKITLPENKELNDKTITLIKDYPIKYTDLKNLVLKNIESYRKNPEGFIESLKPKEARKEPKPAEGKVEKEVKSIEEFKEPDLVEYRQLKDMYNILEGIEEGRGEKFVKDIDQLMSVGANVISSKEMMNTFTELFELRTEGKFKVPKREKRIEAFEKEEGKEPTIPKVPTREERFRDFEITEGKDLKVDDIPSREERFRQFEAEEITKELTAKPDRLKEASNQALKNIVAGEKLTSGIDPTLLKDYATVGAFQARELARKGIEKTKQFAEWSKDMVKRLGKTISPFLKSIWENVKAFATGEKAITEPGMLAVGLGGIGEGKKKPELGKPTTPPKSPFQPPQLGRGDISKPPIGKTIDAEKPSVTTPTQVKKEDSLLKSQPKIQGSEETQTKHKYNSLDEKPEITKALDQAYEGKAKQIYSDKIIEQNLSRDERDLKVNKPLSNNASRKNSAINADQRIDELGKVLNTDLLSKDPKAWKATFDNLLGKAKEKGKAYIDYNLPPVFIASQNKIFKPFHEAGEELVSGSVGAKNRIIFSEKLWNNAAKFNALPADKITHLLESINRYEMARYREISGVTGGESIEKNMTWDQFADWARLDAKQKEVLDVYRKSLDAAIAKRQEMDALFLTEFDNKIASELTEGEIKKYIKTFKKGIQEERLEQLEGKSLEEQQGLMNDWANDDIVFKEEIAIDLAGRKYPDWGKNFYYNASRPVEPNTWHINARKAKDISGLPETLKEQFKGDERVFTYGESETQARTITEGLKKLGYEVEEPYRIKDIIKDNSYVNRLTEIEIRELADAGHIEYNNEVIDRLIDATKRGVNVHNIHKEYIPGMKYTNTEFESQFRRFVSESIQGGYKNYYLRKMETDLSALRSRANAGEKDLITTIKYTQGYINQLRQPEKSWIDNVRFVTMAFHVGLFKPAFLLMQATQTVQTGLAEMVRNSTDSGSTTGAGFKAWGQAWSDAPNYQFALRERLKKGTPSEELVIKYNINADKFAMLEKLQWNNKITASGITEIMAVTSELDLQHQTGYKKHIDVLGRVVSAAGRGIERLTRMQTALGMMDIGLAKGLKDQPLMEFISAGIDKAMGEFGKGGRAPILYGKKKGQIESSFVHGLRKSILTYKNYSFYNFGQWQEMIRNKQFSAIWTKAVVGMGLHGLIGMPLAVSLMGLADLFTDEDMDYEMYKLSDELDKLLGGDAGKVLTRGVGNFLGVDASDMFAEITPLATDVLASAWGDTWEERVTNIVEGAAVGFAKDVINEANNFRLLGLDMIKGNTISTDEEVERGTRILKKLSPVTVRNVWNAMTMKEDGIEVRGKVMVFREDLTMLDIALKTLSFPLYKQRKAYSESKFGPEAQYEMNKRIASEATKYMNDLRRKKNLQPEAMRAEIRRMVKIRLEARAEANKFKREAFKIRRQRKLSKSLAQ